MKLTLGLAVVLLTLGTAAAQRHKLPSDLTSAEGQLLQLARNESDEKQKVVLLEDFVAHNPTHPGAAWAYENLLEIYEKTNQPDKVIATGEKLFGLDPADAVAGHSILKAALESKRDPDLVLKWAVLTSEAARRMAQQPKPAEESAVEDWKRNVDYAQQLDVYTEYTLYAMVLQTPDPKKRILLGDALEQRNGTSKYVGMAAEPRFAAYHQAGDHSGAVALAERTIAHDQSNPEMLLAVAQSHVARKQPDNAVDLAVKAAAAAKARPKPEGISDADWQARTTQLVARAQLMEGLGEAARQKWPAADKALRAALPALTAPEMKAEALFQLGFVNYQIATGYNDRARAVEAVKFSDQCAAMPGPYKTVAAKNAAAFRKKFNLK